MFVMHVYHLYIIVPVIDGGWSNWTEAGVCSLTCGGGQLRYERKCDNPVPQNGGLPCAGLDYKYEPCNNQCCQGKEVLGYAMHTLLCLV